MTIRAQQVNTPHPETPGRDPDPPRHIVVVDTETTGLNPAKHVCVEIGWWDLTTDERGYFIPRHSVSDALANADIAALRLNRYIDRIAGAPQGTIDDAVRLAEVLAGNTLAGSNPAFDAAFLTAMYETGGLGILVGAPEWHHRLADIANLTAGALGVDPRDLPGLATCCELWGVTPGDHTATGDVEAAGQCFLALARYHASRREGATA